MKKSLTTLATGLLCLGAVAAEAADGPIRILYLGEVDPGSGQNRPSSRTDYVYLPGQTLAPEAIYFDYLSDLSHLTDKYLSHFDAVVQVLPDSEIDAEQQVLLDAVDVSGRALIKFSDGETPTDEALRSAVLSGVDSEVRSGWEAFLEARPQLERLPGEVPNYERRPEPVKLQAPLSPEDSMKYTQVPADFELQLFAAEPDIVMPMYVAWDERGRAWVVEGRDYPHGLVPEGEPGTSTVKICEDTDGDGRADKFTVFADGLNIATSMVFVNGGIIVSEARHMLFLQDTDGDDKADVREILLPGWGTGDTHAQQSNLTRGFDNWIYGAVGYSSFNGTVGGEQLRFGQGIYRFKPDGSVLQFLHQYNNNTWGLGMNAYGDVFGSTANNNPTFYGYLPAYIVDPTNPPRRRRGEPRDENTPQVRRISSALSMAPGMRMHPNTPNVRMVDQFGGYTAAAGHTFVVNAALPERLQGKALVTEPTAKLIGMMDIERDGAGYQAKDGLNLLASTDEWMSPIFAEVGPDNAIWVVDFYSFVIQHNPTPNVGSAGIEASTGQGGAYMTENNLRDQSHGRIYRMVWKNGPEVLPGSLAGADAPRLVASLDSGSQFWSLTGQRLIVDNNVTEAVPDLRERVVSGIGGKGAIHALWSLEGLGELDADTHRAALLDKDPNLRRNAIRALPATDEGRQLFFSSPVIQDPDLLTRQVAFVKLLEFPTIPEIQTVVAQLSRVSENTEDEFLNDSVTVLGRVHNVSGVGTDEVEVAAGDPARGRELFFNSPTAVCSSCHMVGGQGGVIGPVLDGIAARSDADYIRESLMDPNATLAEGYKELEVSPMPPLGMTLSAQEVADILAFLGTLETPPADGVIVPVQAPNEFD